MVLSGKFSLSGFYDYCAFRISHAAGSPVRGLEAAISRTRDSTRSTIATSD